MYMDILCTYVYKYKWFYFVIRLIIILLVYRKLKNVVMEVIDDANLGRAEGVNTLLKSGFGVQPQQKRGGPGGAKPPLG